MSPDRHLLLFCADCGDERPFEQPPCDDDHGADCPEWACVECGAAILLGPTPATAVTAAASTTGASTTAVADAGTWSRRQSGDHRPGGHHPGDGRHRRYVA